MTIERSNRWYLPTTPREALDCLEDVKNLVSFLTEVIVQEHEPTEVPFRLYEPGLTGLYCLLSFMEYSLDDCLKLLTKGVE